MTDTRKLAYTLAHTLAIRHYEELKPGSLYNRPPHLTQQDAQDILNLLESTQTDQPPQVPEPSPQPQEAAGSQQDLVNRIAELQATPIKHRETHTPRQTATHKTAADPTAKTKKPAKQTKHTR